MTHFESSFASAHTPATCFRELIENGGPLRLFWTPAVPGHHQTKRGEMMTTMICEPVSCPMGFPLSTPTTNLPDTMWLEEEEAEEVDEIEQLKEQQRELRENLLKHRRP